MTARRRAMTTPKIIEIINEAGPDEDWGPRWFIDKHNCGGWSGGWDEWSIDTYGPGQAVITTDDVEEALQYLLAQVADLKLRNHLLRTRTDLPIERLKAYEEIEADLAVVGVAEAAADWAFEVLADGPVDLIDLDPPLAVREYLGLGSD